MSQYIVYMMKTPITKAAKAGFSATKIFMVEASDDMKTIYEAMTEMGVVMPPYEVFTADVQKKIENPDTFELQYMLPNGIMLTIERVLEFKNVPSGRSTLEIVAAIYFAAVQNGLIHEHAIKYLPGVFDIVSAQEKVINPETFDWNMSKLIDTLYMLLRFSCHLEYTPDGFLYPDVWYYKDESLL